jgi:hypothetical protein
MVGVVLGTKKEGVLRPPLSLSVCAISGSE